MSKEFTVGLSPDQYERLALLLEEMGEAQQILGKILRHGMDSFDPFDKKKTSNRKLLSVEIGHVQFAIKLLVDAKDLFASSVVESQYAKGQHIGRYLHFQQALAGKEK